MPDDVSFPPPPTPSTSTPDPVTRFNIGEEFGTAKKNLPPIKIVLIGVAVIAVVALIASLTQRPHSATTGSIDDVISVEIPDQNSIMVAINVSFQNNGEKPYWIHTIKADLDTATGSFTDDAASPSDFDRYFQAFPTLKQHALAPLEHGAQHRVVEERAVGDRVVDAFEVLRQPAAGADRQMADLGVAHLTWRKPGGLARRGERRVRPLRPEPVEHRCVGELDRVAGTGRGTSPAIEDDERYEWEAARQIAANDSTSRDAPPTRAPSMSGRAQSSAAFSRLTEPP